MTRGAVRYRRLPAPGGFEERRALREIAARLAAAPPESGMLLEWRSPGGAGVAASADPAASGLLAGPAPGPAGTGEGTPAPFPLVGRRLALAVLEPDVGPSISVEADGRSDAPTLPAPLPEPFAPGGSWVVQLHLGSVGAPGLLAGSLRIGVSRPADPDGRIETTLLAHLGAHLAEVGTPARVRRVRAGARRRRELRTGALRSFGSVPRFRWRADRIDRLAPRPAPDGLPGARGPSDHAVVFGASGSGKTALLADWAARAIRSDRPVVAFDLHGDLAAAVLARLGPTERRRLIALDLDGPAGPGFDLFGGGTERARTHLLAALRRGSDDRGEVYWGFRLDRIFDVFLGLVAEEGGGLRDLYDLLTDDRRREAARLSTTSELRARFLDELRPILQRQPDFLWPSAARLGRLVGDDRLRPLLSPRDGGLDAAGLIADGRSLIIRLPIGAVGPELAGLAATLLAGHLFLARMGTGAEAARPTLFVFDEAQAFAPTLLAEILAEGRKFGVAAVLATQFPGRFAPVLESAAAGTVGTHVVLRSPAATAGATARWLGEPEAIGPLDLPELPAGAAWARRAPEPLVRHLPAGPRPSAPDVEGWRAAVLATAAEFASEEAEEGDRGSSEVERVLRCLRSRELGGDPAEGLGSPSQRTLLRTRGWIRVAGDGAIEVTEAGRAFLGERAETGAVSESAAHRGLLVRAAELFARQGETLAILRQGRFDTRLPDAVLRLLPPEAGGGNPSRTLERLLARRTTWAWRAFGGTDVHVEAEVSGADRRARIRHDLEKAKRAGVHCLFLVGDSRRAARIRRVLVEEGGAARSATVWVLRPPPPGERPAVPRT